DQQLTHVHRLCLLHHAALTLSGLPRHAGPPGAAGAAGLLASPLAIRLAECVGVSCGERRRGGSGAAEIKVGVDIQQLREGTGLAMPERRSRWRRVQLNARVRVEVERLLQRFVDDHHTTVQSSVDLALVEFLAARGYRIPADEDR